VSTLKIIYFEACFLPWLCYNFFVGTYADQKRGETEMESMTETATAKTAYGKTLDTPIDYTFNWDNYTGYVEVRDAKDELSEDEVVKVRNGERKAKARQAALTEALDKAGIKKPTLEDDPQFRLRSMYNILIAAKKSPTEARDLASKTLGIEWAESK
jgi:hypothetical protein